jgi:hypothetical protein
MVSIINPPLPRPSKTIVIGRTQQRVEPNEVERLIKAGFKSANNMLLSFISLVFTVKELVTVMDVLSENKRLSVPA